MDRSAGGSLLSVPGYPAAADMRDCTTADSVITDTDDAIRPGHAWASSAEECNFG